MKTKSVKIVNYTPPQKMPRKRDRDLDQKVPVDVTVDTLLSPLELYLRQNKISMAAFSRAMGVSQKSVMTWMRGDDSPSLAAAYEIERITKGVIPMECWLALPSNQSRLAQIREKQPAGIQRIVPPAPGGFAAGPEVKARQTVSPTHDLNGRLIEKNIHRKKDILATKGTKRDRLPDDDDDFDDEGDLD